jgi:hypothetical protein
MQAYNDSLPLMCDSPPRFSAWTTIIQEISPPFFLPPLQYNTTDGTDLVPDAVLVAGVDKTDYSKVQVGTDGLSIHPIRLPSPDGFAAPPKRSETSVTKHSPAFNGTLISSSYPGHSARRLCGSGNSYGPDVVSEADGLF